MQQNFESYRPSGPPVDQGRSPCAPPVQEFNSLKQYSLSSASKQPHLLRSYRVDPVTVSYPGPPPELVAANRTSQSSVLSDGVSSVGLHSPSPPTLRPRNSNKKELRHQDPSPFSLPLPLSSSDVVSVHLPFPSVLTGQKPETLPGQPIPGHSPSWCARRPQSPPLCGAPRFRGTSSERVSPPPAEEDARLLMDLRSGSVPSFQQPNAVWFTPTHPSHDDHEEFQGDKKRRRLTTMAVGSLVATSVAQHSH